MAGGLAPDMTSAAATPAGPQPDRTTAAARLPSRQRQIQVLTAVLANMHKNFKALNQLTSGQIGPQDVFDYGVGDLWMQGIDGAGTTSPCWKAGTSWLRHHAGGARPGVRTANPEVTTIYPARQLPASCPPGMAGLGDYGSCTAWESELLGDVFIAHLIAPYAKILVSATPADPRDDAASQIAMPEMVKALEVISSRHLANVISISDGTGEATTLTGPRSMPTTLAS